MTNANNELLEATLNLLHVISTMRSEQDSKIDFGSIADAVEAAEDAALNARALTPAVCDNVLASAEAACRNLAQGVRRH